MGGDVEGCKKGGREGVSEQCRLEVVEEREGREGGVEEERGGGRAGGAKAEGGGDVEGARVGVVGRREGREKGGRMRRGRTSANFEGGRVGGGKADDICLQQARRGG